MLKHFFSILDYDPHSNQTQCVDVSTYTYPEWVNETRNCCSTEFVKNTTEIWEEVTYTKDY
jgi:hypothetical protein